MLAVSKVNIPSSPIYTHLPSSLPENFFVLSEREVLEIPTQAFIFVFSVINIYLVGGLFFTGGLYITNFQMLK